jgi:hypothetical protein
MAEIINYLQGFHNQQEEIRIIIALTRKVLGETVPYWEEADIQKVTALILRSSLDLEQLTATALKKCL